MVYRLLRALIRHGMRVFYRSIEVEGLETVPTSGPLILAANHPNTLMDVLLVAMMLDRRVGFIAKATLFDNPFAGALLRFLGAVPIHRTQDGSSPAGKAANAQALAASEEAVAEGRAILIFPEGVSQDEPRLQRVKTGVARIAIGAERRAPGQVRVVPVGLVYDDYDTFRSRARVRFLEPIAVAPFLDLAEDPEDFTPVRALTDAIRDSLREDVVHVEDESHDRLVAQVDELYGHQAKERAGGRLAVTPVVARAVNHFAREDPARVRRVAQQLSAYRAALVAEGVDDAAVRGHSHDPRLADQLLFYGFALVALWGALNHLLLYNAPRAALRLIPVHRAYHASGKFLVGLLALGVCYGAQGALVYWLAAGPLDHLFHWTTPWTPTLVYVGTLPLSGMIALLWFEAYESRRHRASMARERRRLGAQLSRLRTLRAALFAELDAAQADFLAHLERQQAPPRDAELPDPAGS